VSGILPWPAVPQWAFGYALVARQLYAATFTHAVDTPREALTVGGVSLPLPTQVIAQSNLTSRANEFTVDYSVALGRRALLDVQGGPRDRTRCVLLEPVAVTRLYLLFLVEEKTQGLRLSRLLISRDM
jgi:hypothetical protein